MRYATVCSGIEAPSFAWHPLGWNPVWFSEIEAFPSAVLKYHYPNVPNLGDMTKIYQHDYFKETIGSVDLLCGGTPCQSFSVAGLRKGMEDPRGNLALVFLALIDQLRPRWVVWENVPGVLSSNGGRDFGSFVGGLGQLGYGWAYRILDAQYFGVPQRRRRVFVVGYLGDWRRAAAVLFERNSLSGHPAPRREKGKGFAADVAPSLTASGRGVERPGESRGQDPVVAVGFGESTELSRCVTTGEGSRMDYETTTMVVANPLGAPSNGPRNDLDHETFVVAYDPNQMTSKTNRSNPSPELCHTLPASSEAPIAVSVHQNQEGEIRMYDVSPTISTTSNASARQTGKVFNGLAVRRLTPRECERLQGFPDDYTLIDWTSRASAAKIAEDMIKYFRRAGYSEEAARMAAKHPDGPRYKALGNSMAVPVMRWIGERIQTVDAI